MFGLQLNEAVAMARQLRVSPRKLNDLVAGIRGKKVQTAIADLSFSRRRIARDVLKTLESAISNAENNHGLDIGALIVSEAYVGKSVRMRRWSPMARGRSGRIEKDFSRLTIIVREVRRDS